MLKKLCIQIHYEIERKRDIGKDTFKKASLDKYSLCCQIPISDQICLITCYYMCFLLLQKTKYCSVKSEFSPEIKSILNLPKIAILFSPSLFKLKLRIKNGIHTHTHINCGFEWFLDSKWYFSIKYIFWSRHVHKTLKQIKIIKLNEQIGYRFRFHTMIRS